MRAPTRNSDLHANPTARTSSRKGPVTILLVDDVPQNLVALDALLRDDDVLPLLAASGSEALEVLLEEDVALALIDVQMPDMDGFELAELMRGSPRTRHVPIIFLTATDRDAKRMFAGYEAGAVDFLYKPFDPHVLRSKVSVFVQLQQQKQQLAEQLDTMTQMVRMNEMFVAVLSHDLRNPLAAIMNNAEVLRRTADPEHIARSASRIRCSGERMAQMIEQLLDIARMRSGQLQITTSQWDLAELAGTIIGEFETPEHPGTVSFDARGDTVGFWDKGRIAQILSNLVGNALRHGDPADAVRVLVDGGAPESVTLSVQNGGVIPEGARAHLFTPFRSGNAALEAERLSLASMGAQGLGLGLFIAHELVRMHDGTIRVASTAETGTTFAVTLPRRVEKHQILEAEAERAAFAVQAPGEPVQLVR